MPTPALEIMTAPETADAYMAGAIIGDIAGHASRVHGYDVAKVLAHPRAYLPGLARAAGRPAPPMLPATLTMEHEEAILLGYHHGRTCVAPKPCKCADCRPTPHPEGENSMAAIRENGYFEG
jgi:hypothetical protein